MLLVLLALLAGCQPVDTFNPLYTDKDVSFDPSILGKWAQDQVTLELSDSGNNTYNLVFSDANSPQRMVMDGHLVVLQGHRFLDLIQKSWIADPESFSLAIEQTKNGLNVAPNLIRAGDGAYLEFLPGSPASKNSQVKVKLRIAHWFVRVTNDDKNLQFAFIDDDRLAKSLQARSVAITHILIKPTDEGSSDRHLALTATTAELQKFVLEHVNDDQVFADTLKFHRPDSKDIQGQ
ncbi:MAG TPA: hypothetical protein VI685_25490 [Candidatus Angelobacter sp.]